MRWLDAAPPADRPKLAAWCSTVGTPVVMAPAPAAPPQGAAGAPGPDPARLDSLVLVSWNVHVGGGSLEALLGDLRAGRLTGGAPPPAFVVLLQEVYRAGGDIPPLAARAVTSVPHRIAPPPPAGLREDVVAVARRNHLWLLYVPSMRNGPGVAAPREDRGAAILSTLPLEDPAAMELPLETQRRVPVLASVAGVTTGGVAWKLRVVAAHLDHRAPFSRILESFGAARLQQARVLADALPDDEPIALGADLNSWAPASLERAVPFLRHRFPSGDPEPAGSTFTLAGIGRRLDHFFFRLPAGWRAHERIVPDRYGSDHNPLVAVVRFGPRRGAPR